MAAAAKPGGDQQRPLRRNSSVPWLPPSMSELRVVLLGNSWSERSKVGNFILGERAFDAEAESHRCLRVRGQVKDNDIVLVSVPDVLHPDISEDKLTEHVEHCVRLSAPGPHVLLLVLQPEGFTQQHSERLQSVLQLFSDRSFDHSLVLISTPRDEGSGETHMDNPALKDVIAVCRYRCVKQEKLEPVELLIRLGQTAKENSGEHLSCDVFEAEDSVLYMSLTSDPIKPALNLVLCGRRGAVKTSAAKAILGQTELHSASNSSESVKHQGEVCGRRVSLVELPALCGKPQETVMEESFRCISLCDPEGVHAFILVLPVDPLTDEDKEELQSIQNTFSSQVNGFMVILFTVESDPTHPAVVDFVRRNRDVQELCQSCGGRSVVLNIRDRQQVSELMETVEKMRGESRCFTKDMFTKALIETFVKQDKTNTDLQVQLHDMKQTGGGDEGQSGEPLRMVLIGKTGSGKSATANTILGKRHFEPRLPPKPSIKTCEKVSEAVEGRPVAVVNTPSLFGDEFQQDTKRCVSLLSPGPHVFLLVLQIGHFAEEERDSVELIKKYFGKKSQAYTIIVFTRGDELEGQPFESYITRCPDFVKQLINDCGGRYQVFDNKGNTNPAQVHELLLKTDAMVKDNGGGCYNAEVCDNTDKLERVLKEKEDEVRRKEEEVKTLRKKISEQAAECDVRAKQLKEKDASISKEREERRKEEEKRWKRQEEALRQDWRRKLEASEKTWQSQREQRENAEKKLEQCRKEMKKEREAWDKEKQHMWERTHQDLRQNLEEERSSLRKLQGQYQRKRRLWTGGVFVLSLLLLFLLWHFVMSYTHAHDRRR